MKKSEKKEEMKKVKQSNQLREKELLEETAAKEENPQKDDPGCRGDCVQLLDKLAYLSADFENYRKNVIKERAQWTETAQSEVLKTILKVIDDFERALKEFKEATDLSEERRVRFKGFEIIYQSLLKILESYNVKEIEIMKEFDPKKHEAVMQTESDEKKSGEIVEVLEKGYVRGNMLIRPAKVSVAK